MLTKTIKSEEDVASDHLFKLIREWIRTCDADHMQCPKTANPLPTRVIDVSVIDNPKLYVTHGEILPYLALSYCWGTKKVLTTTSQNIQQHMVGIPTSDLPQTVRDAITVTQRLGIRYLWIDALCIIQDSDDDKDNEIGKMASIYKNSYLTICAARASGSEMGFLGKRDTRSVEGAFSIPMSFQTPHAHGLMNHILLVEKGLKRDIIDPLHKRGWTLQEVMLSPRVLMYSCTQLYFVCQETAEQDGGVDDWFAYSKANGYHRLWGLPRSCSKGQSREAHNEPDNMSVEEEFKNDTVSKDTELTLKTGWDRVIQDYARRGLTVASDKLPALSALAEEFNRVTGDQYAAGMWRSWMPGNLLWRVKAIASRPTEWRAPSWSWLAVDAEIWTPDEQGAQVYSSVAEVVECTVIPRTNVAPFAQLVYAELQLRSYPATLLRAGPTTSERLYSMRGADQSNETCWVQWDPPFPDEAASGFSSHPGYIFDIPRPSTEHLCLPISVSDGNVRGLVISTTEQTGAYRRKGFFVSHNNLSLLQGQKRVYTLI